MSDGVMIEISGDGATVEKLRAKRDQFGVVINQTMQAVILAIKNQVVEQHLSGPTGPNSLSRKTGALARSVQVDVTTDGDVITGRVFYTGDVIYARIHELGGDIYPVNAKALRFMVGGKMVITQHVRMPARAPMRTGFKERIPQSIDMLKAAITSVVAGQ